MFQTTSVIVFIVQFFGYIVMSLFLQLAFIYQQRNKSEAVIPIWGMPIVSIKPGRGKYHGLISLFNLTMASTFAAVTTELSLRRINQMRFEMIDIVHLSTILCELLLAVVYQSVVEYYWHRLMHLPFFYKRFHKYHHFYKSPEPWDDMYIHPIEAAGYYCILYGPPYLFSIHYVTFLLYMVIMGSFGTLDHSGVNFVIYGLYNTIDHDSHHGKFEVNYSFPFPHMDILHGTFDGQYLGHQYMRRSPRK